MTESSLDRKIARAAREAEEERRRAAGMPIEKFAKDDHQPDGTVRPPVKADTTMQPKQQLDASRWEFGPWHGQWVHDAFPDRIFDTGTWKEAPREDLGNVRSVIFFEKLDPKVTTVVPGLPLQVGVDLAGGPDTMRIGYAPKGTHLTGDDVRAMILAALGLPPKLLHESTPSTGVEMELKWNAWADHARQMREARGPFAPFISVDALDPADVDALINRPASAIEGRPCEITWVPGAWARPKQPPLGIRPRFIVDAEREHEIHQAIARYREAGKPWPIAWVRELRELIDRRLARAWGDHGASDWDLDA